MSSFLPGSTHLIDRLFMNANVQFIDRFFGKCKVATDYRAESKDNPGSR